jgi:similar to spore coat protein
LTKYLGLHETLETLELIAFKTVCLTKTVTMSKLLPDGDLKTILSGDLESGSQGLKQLQTFITNREETHND